MTNYIGYLLSKKALKQSTIKRKVKALKSLVHNGADLGNPDKTMTVINTSHWANGTKDIVANAYADYLQSIGLNVKIPEQRPEEKLPFIPLEQEIDSIISSVRPKTMALLRIAKETACRPIEIWRLRWIDLDVTNRALSISPAKYSHARKLKVTEQTLNLLLALPRRNQHIFSVNGNYDDELEHFNRNYQKVRNRIADRLKNPRLRQISLQTFRHWKATMEYVKTRDIVHVKEMLGHVNIKNTLRYIHLANAIANNEEAYVCKVAKSIDEATSLIESGFEYVTDMDGMKMFRKRK